MIEFTKSKKRELRRLAGEAYKAELARELGGTSIVFGFILTFPLALLFEIGGDSILGGALFYLAVDSVNWFKEASEPGLPMNIYLGSIFIAAVIVTFAGVKLKPGMRERRILHAPISTWTRVATPFPL